MRLSTATVNHFNQTAPASAASSSVSGKVSFPKYDRSQLTGGILHVGVGNFHRSHQAAYVDALLNTDFEHNKTWGIIGAGILSFDAAKREILEPQNWLQTVVEKDATHDTPHVIGSMIDFLPVDYKGKKHKELKAALMSPNIKIVSLTVTEGGYFLNDGKFDPLHPQIRFDIENPDQPETIFGMMVQALKQRRATGMAPFTVLSCDNVPHNGSIIRSVVVGLASEMDAELGQWIDKTIAFPNSMVDRITPGTTDYQRTWVKEHYDFEDAAPIFCEPFRQWVLEDVFPQGRPTLEQLEGVKFVTDVAPYENMKIRILNGGHASLCYPSALLGVQYVHEAMEHPTIGPFLNALERNEIIPTVPPVPDTVLTEYWELIAKRFENPTLQDTIGRNCYDGANRQPKFIVPVATDGVKAGRPVDGLALVSAMWCRYCQGTTEAGETIAPNDPQWDRLQALAKQAATEDPQLWLTGLKEVYGSIAHNPSFVQAFSKAMQTIQKDGVESAMQQYTASKTA